MTNQELKNYLQKRKAKCEQLKALNFQKNKSMDGTFICTTYGREKDQYLKGKIEILDAVLERLESE